MMNYEKPVVELVSFQTEEMIMAGRRDEFDLRFNDGELTLAGIASVTTYNFV